MVVLVESDRPRAQADKVGCEAPVVGSFQPAVADHLRDRQRDHAALAQLLLQGQRPALRVGDQHRLVRGREVGLGEGVVGDVRRTGQGGRGRPAVGRHGAPPVEVEGDRQPGVEPVVCVDEGSARPYPIDQAAGVGGAEMGCGVEDEERGRRVGEAEAEVEGPGRMAEGGRVLHQGRGPIRPVALGAVLEGVLLGAVLDQDQDRGDGGQEAQQQPPGAVPHAASAGSSRSLR